MRQHFWLFYGVLSLVCLCGCTSLNNSFVFPVNDLGLHVVLDVPYQRQISENLCGLAVVEMLTRYHGVPLNQTQRDQLVKEAGKIGGISDTTLKAVLQEAGYFAYIFNGLLGYEVTGLYHNLDQKRPVVVMYGPKDGTIGHYVLVTGYDRLRGVLVVMDPLRGRQVEREEKFLPKWERSGRFTLLVMPKS